MGSKLTTLICTITLMLLLTACGEAEGTFAPASEEKTIAATEFVNQYKEDMIFHTNEGSFSEIEPYLIPNTTFYHLVRRHVNDLQQESRSIRLIEHSVSDVLVNEFNDYHVYVTEITETTDRRGDKVVEELEITYELVEFEESFRIISIMKR